MTDMPQKPTWDITNLPDPDNIRRILNDLRHVPDVPMDAIEALERLLVRAEDAEQHPNPNAFRMTARGLPRRAKSSTKAMLGLSA